MFQKIRYQLLLSNLIVLTIILTAFAITVRITFAYSLNQQLIDRLNTLARAAATGIDIEDGEVETDDEEIIAGQNQAVQWFDVEGEFLAQQGEYPLSLPLDISQSLQKQNSPYPAQGLTTPVNDDESGEFVGYVRVSESLTEVQSITRRLDLGLGGGVFVSLVLSGFGGIWLTRQAMQPIEENFQRLQQFTSDASHELRSPLMAIKTNAAVALKYSEGIRSKDSEKFQMIGSAANQMTRLTERLLILARTDKLTQPDWEIVNLTSLLSKLWQFYNPHALRKKIDFKDKIAGNLYLRGDKVLLTQLFTNLIKNAIYYTPLGGVVEIIAKPLGSNLIIKVQDNGIGIAPEYLEKVFERFWRAEKSRSYKAKKFGLGLAIAQTIAQKHGGLITVDSQLGKGSCFTTRLPRVEKLKNKKLYYR
ncbi:sensor histidine kinase [Dapis sp. BLCC M126]|uniref:sensor histidine kinase n=1 Tax=Dapis sp. BLCC M126 TaxID=3400189 RepID=UPI003CF5516F